MVRSLIKLLLELAGNALGLLLAAAILDNMEIDGAAFVVAILIFTGVAVITKPLITKMAVKNAEALQGSSALITTFIALVLTALISDGLSIDGFDTWIFATLIVWLVTLVAGIILPMIFLKKVVVEER
ncbi:MAG: phage holin family protein [Actinobacteria bacterium]|jgi:putative membrane protein|nr:phage holin family protein [Actinomycetota bacterium]